MPLTSRKRHCSSISSRRSDEVTRTGIPRAVELSPRFTNDWGIRRAHPPVERVRKPLGRVGRALPGFRTGHARLADALRHSDLSAGPSQPPKYVLVAGSLSVRYRAPVDNQLDVLARFGAAQQRVIYDSRPEELGCAAHRSAGGRAIDYLGLELLGEILSRREIDGFSATALQGVFQERDVCRPVGAHDLVGSCLREVTVVEKRAAMIDDDRLEMQRRVAPIDEPRVRAVAAQFAHQ